MSKEPIKILLVTPDIQWQAKLYFYLTQHGFEVVGAVGDAATAFSLFRIVCPHLVVIEARLPDVDGLSLAQLMQIVHPEVKVVLVVADDPSFQLAALQAGAAGCINREFPLTEWPSLLNYIYAGGAVFSQILMEEVLLGNWLAKSEIPVVSVGPLTIDIVRRQVTISRQPVFLTPREFALLACLARNVGRVITFEQLLNEAWGYDTEAGTGAQVRVYINRLRQKLMSDPQAPDFIVTERGVGYRLLSHGQWRQKADQKLSNIFNLPRLSKAGSGIFFCFQDSPLEMTKIEKGKTPVIHSISERLPDLEERIGHHIHHNPVDQLWSSFVRGLHRLENEATTHGYELLQAMHELTDLYLDDLVVKYAYFL